jgi:hypothetical protein
MSSGVCAPGGAPSGFWGLPSGTSPTTGVERPGARGTAPGVRYGSALEQEDWAPPSPWAHGHRVRGAGALTSADSPKSFP